MKKKYFLGAFIFIIIQISLVGQPLITSFAPSSGPIGSTITINGLNFNPTIANNIVFFGATKAVVSSVSATIMTVTVPVGATHHPISITDITTNLTAYSEHPFIVTFSCSGAFTSGTFASSVSLSTGNTPVGSTICDLNMDGRADIITADYADSISILKNISSLGMVSFAPKINYYTGVSTQKVAHGDFDGDGKPDLVVTRIFEIVVFLNTSIGSSISFAPGLILWAGSQPIGVAISDLNGDGKLDIIETNYNDNAISVLENTSTIGSLSFSPGITFATGIGPYGLCAGDVDGDLKPDVVVANQVDNTLSILKNTSASGIISFSPKIDFLTGSKPYYVCRGDLNGDGKVELAVNNYNDHTFSVFLNTGTGGVVSFAPKVDFSAGAFPFGIAMGDLNGDGLSDLATTNYGMGTVSIMKNISMSGSVSFDPEIFYLAGSMPNYISLGDIDGDGKTDLSATNRNTHTVSILLNQCIATEIETDEYSALKINTYPNPFTTQTTIDLNTDYKYATLKIIDVLGKELKNINFSGKQIIFEREELKAGIYFIQIISEGKLIATNKIIIN